MTRLGVGAPSAGLARRLFGFSTPVDRRFYATSGLLLMILKYAVDATALYLHANVTWSPLAYLNPVLSLRNEGLPDPPSWLLILMSLWTLPFIWIGVSMSIRRAADSGLSGWLGLLFFVPIANYLFMLAMCCTPSRPKHMPSFQAAKPAVDDALRSALYGVAAGLAIATAMVGVSVFVLGSYGTALFFGTPFMMGAASAFLFNRRETRSLRSTLTVAMGSVLVASGAMLLFALEGVVCITMALPLASGTAILGSLAGRALAREPVAPAAHVGLVVLMLPFLAGAERLRPAIPTAREVLSTIDVEAPPALVWPHVIGFAELDPPAEWFFRLGIAYPMRATIEGRGNGALRRCEFSTGPFLEPITLWDEPSILAFDVVSQPPPMHEWSPYRHVYAPHLAGTMESRRGEFRLLPLAGERTRIEARTWYELDLFPQSYWTIWANLLVGAIHQRVLHHIKDLAERKTVPQGG